MPQVSLETKLARRYTLEGIEKAVAYLLIKATPQGLAGAARLPMNVALVLDTSSSMDGEKIECAKEAACLVVETLSANDWLSLVTFTGNPRVVVSGRKVTDKNVYFAPIRDFKADDGTRMSTGMDAGLKELKEAGAGLTRMLLFTDGLTSDEDKCLKLAHEAAERRIPISCFGIGDNYNEELLREISRITLGSPYHLQQPGQMKQEFANELQSAASIGITNANLAFNMVKGVALEELHRIVPNIAKLEVKTTDDRNASAMAGDLDCNEPTCFGARLSLPMRPAGQVRLVRLTLAYDVPAMKISQDSSTSDVIIEYTGNRDLCGQVDKEVMGYFDQLAAQELVEQAAKAAQAGKVPLATQKLGQAKVLTQRIGNAAMTRHLENAINELERKGTMSAGAQKTIRLGSVHTVKVKENP